MIAVIIFLLILLWIPCSIRMALKQIETWKINKKRHGKYFPTNKEKYGKYFPTRQDKRMYEQMWFEKKANSPQPPSENLEAHKDKPELLHQIKNSLYQPVSSRQILTYLAIIIVFIFVAIALVVNKKFIDSPNQTAASPPQTAQTAKKFVGSSNQAAAFKNPCPDFDKVNSIHYMAAAATPTDPSFLYDTKKTIGKCYKTAIRGWKDMQWLSPTSMLYFFYDERFGRTFTVRIDYDGYEPLPDSLDRWKAVIIGIGVHTYIAQRGPVEVPHFKVVKLLVASGYRRDRDGKVFKTYEEIEKYGENSWQLFFTEKKKKY